MPRATSRAMRRPSPGCMFPLGPLRSRTIPTRFASPATGFEPAMECSIVKSMHPYVRSGSTVPAVAQTEWRVETRGRKRGEKAWAGRTGAHLRFHSRLVLPSWCSAANRSPLSISLQAVSRRLSYQMQDSVPMCSCSELKTCGTCRLNDACSVNP